MSRGSVYLTWSASVLDEVSQERGRQEAKWGQQNHLDGTGTRMPLRLTSVNLDLRSPGELRMIFTRRCEERFTCGEGTWVDILLEEVFEAIDAGGDDLRAELIQVAAVAVAWVEAIDRRRS